MTMGSTGTPLRPRRKKEERRNTIDSGHYVLPATKTGSTGTPLRPKLWKDRYRDKYTEINTDSYTDIYTDRYTEIYRDTQQWLFSLLYFIQQPSLSIINQSQRSFEASALIGLIDG